MLIPKLNIPTLLILGAFSPVVITQFNIRFDQLCMYPLILALFTGAVVLQKPLSVYRQHLDLIVVSVAMLLWTVWATTLNFWINPDASFAHLSKVISHGESYLQGPVILILVSHYCTKYNFCRGDFIKLCEVVLILIALNAIVALGQIIFDLRWFLSFFLPPDGVWTSVWGQRLLGIFNQPSEAGMVYSIGIFVWLYIVDAKQQVTVKDYVLAGLVIIGGGLSISKLFIFGGLPVLVWFVILSGRFRIFFNLKIAFLFICALPVLIFVTNQWIGLGYLMRFVDIFDGGDTLYLLTSGRFTSEGSAYVQIGKKIMSESPLWGHGLAYLTTPDNGYLLYVAEGGLVGLVLYCGLLCMLACKGGCFIKSDMRERWLLCLLVVLFVGGSLGGAVMMLNRVSTLVWVLIAMIYCVVRSNDRVLCATSD